MTAPEQFPATPSGNQTRYLRHNGHGDRSHGREFVADDPTVTHAVTHALTAAKGVIAARMTLMRTELQTTLRTLAGGGILLVAGAAVFVVGWFALTVGAVLSMGVWWGATLSLPVRLLIATAATAIVGIAFLAGGMRAMRRTDAAAD